MAREIYAEHELPWGPQRGLCTQKQQLSPRLPHFWLFGDTGESLSRYKIIAPTCPFSKIQDILNGAGPPRSLSRSSKKHPKES